MKKIIVAAVSLYLSLGINLFASAATLQNISYLKAVINVGENTEVGKSTIFDAEQSFVPSKTDQIKYEWDFGDGNRNEGVEVLHSYKEPGAYTVGLKIINGPEVSESKKNIFVYNKLIVLITDQTQSKDQIELIKNFAEKKGVYIKIVDSFGSSTEFISEEILTKKITEESENLSKAGQIVIWTKENAGLNALSRYMQNKENKNVVNLTNKSITILDNNIDGQASRIQRQFNLIKTKTVILTKEAGIYPALDSKNEQEYVEILKNGGYEYQIINESSGKLRPWNFMSYFVNVMVSNGIPDNTIVLLLLLPVIATVVAFMKQVIGITTFGIYTPSIITLSFLVIGLYAGLLTLLTAIFIGAISRPILRRFRLLFMPKMAIVITAVSLTLFITLIAGIYIGVFDARFLSIAIFPMLILSTLVEKFVSVKSEKGLSTASILMLETLLVSIVAYFIAGGEINIGIATIKFEFVKRSLLNYPEAIFFLIIINVIIGRWSGLRLLEYFRFREVLKNIEE